MNFENLNFSQKIAVESIDGPILVIAGAGTGKTHVLTQRIANIVSNHNVNPHRILAITFSNKATEEMKNRLNNLFPDLSFIWVNTYHALCLKILKQEIDVLGYKKNFTIVDDQDQTTIIKNLIEDHKISLPLFLTPKKILNTIENIKLNDINLTNGYQEFYQKLNIVDAKQIDVILRIYNLYCNYLKKINALDFSDLINFVCEIFDKYPEKVHKWQEKFDYILVDEFQDTNYKQFRIIKFLTNTNKNNIFVVGDPNQTIYTWRGAYAKIFDDFVSWQKNYKLINLEKNYRSTQKIINAANSLIKYNHETFENPLVSVNINNYDVNCFIGNYFDDEASFTVKTIIDLHKNGKPYNKIAILYRSNFSSRRIEEFLIDNQVPYLVYGDVPFYQRIEIKDLLSYFKTIYLFDELSTMRIINVPRRAIGENTIVKINEWVIKNNSSFYLALIKCDEISELPPTTKNKIHNFLKLLNEIKKEIEQTAYDKWIDIIINKINYLEYLKSLTGDYENRLDNIDELKKSLSMYFHKNPQASLIDWINELSLLSSSDKTKANNVPSVQLMTIHAAKGKEYDTVFLINFNEGFLPSSKALATSASAIKEERRIAYVGMTRAINYLYITCSNVHYEHTNISPSRFLKEIRNSNYHRVYREFKYVSKNDDDFFNSKKSFFSNNKITNNFTNTYQFKVGDEVVHSIFGNGIVVDKNGDLLDIVFKRPYGRKTIIATHNALKWVK